MKFQTTPTVVFLTAAAIGTDAYNMYGTGPGRNNCRPPRSQFDRDSFSSSPRSNRFRQRQQRIDKAFRDLQDEMNPNFGPRRGRRSGQFDFMMMDPTSIDFNDVDKEAVKKWVDKAFELASEFNQDFSRTSEDRERNDEVLKKSREWVEQMYTPPTEEKSDEGATGDPSGEVKDFSTTTQDSNEQDPLTPPPPKEPDVITPYSENRSDAETFMVAVDLPGVDRSDVELTLEKDFLVVEAERRSGEEEESGPSRKYLKKFAVVEDEIEVDRIQAALNSGVLTVSAPKKKQAEKDTKIKIPLE